MKEVQEPNPAENALIREGQLLWRGIAFAPEKLKEAFTEGERISTIKTAVFSAGLTFAFACLRRSPTMAWTAGRVLLPALSLSALKDFRADAGAARDAFLDNWNSADNWEDNLANVKEHIGKTAADLVITTIASGLAEGIGASYFGLKTPGLEKIPDLKTANLQTNWHKHQNGETVAYRLFSQAGGGMRRVDLFIPPKFELPEPGLSNFEAKTGLLIAPDGLELGLGRLRNLKPPAMAELNGLANLNMDPEINYVAAFPHAKQFRVLPGVNVAAWFHDSGLIKPGGWLAPQEAFSDAQFIADVERTVSAITGTKRSTIAGFSSGGILANEAAALIGPERVKSVVSVASTVTGLEPAAKPGQFRLYVRDLGDPTLPQTGGPGGKSSILAILGHDSIRNSRPLNQIEYGLEPYPKTSLFSRSGIRSGVYQEFYGLDSGAPVLSYVQLKTDSHGWPNRMTSPSDGSISSRFNGVSRVPELDLNSMIKEIVSGNLERFAL